jgi:hypothetical protein
VFTALPKADSVNDIEALMPGNLNINQLKVEQA